MKQYDVLFFLGLYLIFHIFSNGDMTGLRAGPSVPVPSSSSIVTRTCAEYGFGILCLNKCIEVSEKDVTKAAQIIIKSQCAFFFFCIELQITFSMRTD